MVPRRRGAEGGSPPVGRLIGSATRHAIREPAHEGESILGEVLAAVRIAVPGADHAGMAWMTGNGALGTWAATDVVVDALTRIQQDLGFGPCFAPTEDYPVQVCDLRSDQRWPLFAAEAVSRGIGSVLSLRIPVREWPDRPAVSGALILYAAEADSFTSDDRTMAEVFADRAAEALDETPELFERRRMPVRAEGVLR